MPQYFSAHWIHLIWATKYREPLITAQLKWSLYKQIKTICENNNYYLDFINGVSDHIHILMGLNTTDSVSSVVKNIKGLSQKWVNEIIMPTQRFSWQDGYAVISVSPSNVQKVRNYIKKQEIHHTHKSFETEWNSLKNAVFVEKDEQLFL